MTLVQTQIEYKPDIGSEWISIQVAKSVEEIRAALDEWDPTGNEKDLVKPSFLDMEVYAIRVNGRRWDVEFGWEPVPQPIEPIDPEDASEGLSSPMPMNAKPMPQVIEVRKGDEIFKGLRRAHRAREAASTAIMIAGEKARVAQKNALDLVTSTYTDRTAGCGINIEENGGVMNIIVFPPEGQQAQQVMQQAMQRQAELDGEEIEVSPTEGN